MLKNNMILVLMIVLLTMGCTHSVSGEDKVKSGDDGQDFTQCTEPRPELCTMIYAPVCGLRDREAKCDTEPCASDKRKTYSSSCMACADSKVSGYLPGECKTAE